MVTETTNNGGQLGNGQCTDVNKAERERLFTSYQRAFLKEKVARDAVNAAIRELRKAERELKESAQAICDLDQRKFPFVSV